MIKRLLPALLLTFAIALPSAAGPYDRLLCPPVGGRFIVAAGKLWFEIQKRAGKAVEPQRQQVANPPDGRDAEALTRRGAVSVQAHDDENGKGLFVHWATLKDDE